MFEKDTFRNMCIIDTLSNHLQFCSTLGQEGLLHSDCANLPSYPEHGKVPYLQKICAECLTSFSTNSNLEQHASNSGHTAFSCTCGQQFSRAYTLTRHINSMIGPSFPCELCDNKAFPRLDKLSDHLRRWHRLGVKAFDQYKGGDSPTKPATNSVALPIGGGIAPLQAGVFGQAYHVAPAFEPVSMFNGFPSASSTTPEALSTESSASLGIYTVSTYNSKM